MKGLLCLFLSLSWGQNVAVKTAASGTITAQEAIERFSYLRSSLKKIGNSQACETPQIKQCSFENMCNAFAEKTQSLYVYQDSNGYKVPNYNILINELLIDSCLRKPFPEDLYEDPLLYPHKLVNASLAGGVKKLAENREKYNAAFKRSEGTLDDVRGRMIAYLQSRRTPQNAAEIELAIKKVKMVRLAKATFEKDATSLSHGVGTESCDTPNAFYDPNTASIVVCPQQLNLPEASLFMILSHELAHSMDPCHANYSYLQDADNKVMLDPRTAAPETEHFEGTTASTKPFVEGIAFAKNPFKETVACLNSAKVMNIKPASLERSLSLVDAEIEKIESEAEGQAVDAKTERLKSKKDYIKKEFQNLKHCQSISGNGESQEAFADWMAAQMIEKRLQEFSDSSAAKRFAFETQAPYLSRHCSNLVQAMEQKTKRIVTGKCASLAEEAKHQEEHSEMHSHPQTAARINSIYLASPGLRKALGCSSPKVQPECR